MIAQVLAGVVTGIVAAVVGLLSGQPWWVALALYAGVGAGSVLLLAAVTLLRGLRPRRAAAQAHTPDDERAAQLGIAGG